MTYHLFIGRHQSPHKGHQTIFNEYLNKGEPILIAISDVAPDEKNPLHAEEVKSIWEAIYRGHPLVKIMIIPDIASVNYGRGVGYTVREIKVAKEISNISATEIRNKILSGDDSWKEIVDPAGHEILIHFFKNK